MALTSRQPKLPAFCLAALIAGCSESGPPLSATDMVALVPLPGRDISVAYVTLHNHSQETITVHRVSSPEFAKIEMHESMHFDGVIRMRRLDSLMLDAGTSAQFVTGGKHLMLIEPVPGMVPGDSVTLQFEYNTDGMLIVSTPLKSRM